MRDLRVFYMGDKNHNCNAHVPVIAALTELMEFSANSRGISAITAFDALI